MTGRRALLVLLLAVACRRMEDAPRPTAPSPAPTSPAPAPVAATPGPVQAPQPAQPGPNDKLGAPEGPASRLGEAEQQRRERALEAMDAGRFDLARAELAAILEVAPGNLAVKALLDASTQALLAAREQAALSFANITPLPVPAPPWRYTLAREVAIAAQARAPKLVQVRSEANSITDEAKWFAQHGLRLPEYEVPNPMRGQPGNLPPTIPPTFGANLLVQAIAHPDHTILFYNPDYSGGRFVAVVDAGGRMTAFFDFATYQHAADNVASDLMFVDQGALWAEVVDGVLYISHGHHTYASSSKGMNAYLTALDVATGELRWRSEPLVAGSYNFVIDGAHIFTGYGFTGEPDHVFVLDRRTGKTLGKSAVASAPEYLFLSKDRRLLVRTYDTNLEFELR